MGREGQADSWPWSLSPEGPPQAGRVRQPPTALQAWPETETHWAEGPGERR